MRVFVTGAEGFIGSNLVAGLQRDQALDVTGFDVRNTDTELKEGLASADFVFHLAGVNRPETDEEFETGNVGFTQRVCDLLLAVDNAVPILLSSSVQAELDNPYGASKRDAEEVVKRYARESGARGIICRLRNVFGKWSRPNYNSVVATFCHNIARGLPITISDRDNQVDLIYIDDVVAQFEQELHLDEEPDPFVYREVTPVHPVTLGALADLIRSFRDIRDTLHLPDLSDAFTRKLYGTYLSYLESDDFAYELDKKCDPRGCLAEFAKSESAGQIFVSRTAPGITRGNHCHRTKTEKFLVLEGEAMIRFRHVRNGDVIDYRVRGEEFRVLDIPPGYTHSIENVGSSELVTLFWASEVFNPDDPDTEYLPVFSLEEEGQGGP